MKFEAIISKYFRFLDVLEVHEIQYLILNYI
jgi:hypothetical protein